MKNDNFSRRILAVGIALSAVLLSGSLFMFSVQTANASDNENGINYLMPESQGRIMMDYTSVHVPSQDKTYYECMVWDTQSGRSALYFYSYNDKKFKKYEDNVQLPGSPLD